MTRRRLSAVAAALISAAAVAGCGIGAGSTSEGDAFLSVTRDFGGQTLLEATVNDPAASETVARFLDREAEVEASYGGNFIDQIDGLSGASHGGQRADWFFYVNGYWSPVGAAEARVRSGDRVWWDYRRWEAAYRVPAVVGSWPEPFASGFDGRRFPTSVDCRAAQEICEEASERLVEAGAALLDSTTASGGQDRGPSADANGDGEPARGAEELRVLIGSWPDVRSDPAARLLSSGPPTSGVYGRFETGGGSWELVGLDERGEERERFGAGAGLVGAVRVGEGQPTWLVTGVDEVGVGAAVAMLAASSLEGRYAVAVAPQRALEDDAAAGATAVREMALPLAQAPEGP